MIPSAPEWLEVINIYSAKREARGRRRRKRRNRRPVTGQFIRYGEYSLIILHHLYKETNYSDKCNYTEAMN